MSERLTIEERAELILAAMESSTVVNDAELIATGLHAVDAAARAEERERCALEVEAHLYDCCSGSFCEGYGHGTLQAIAAAIREGSDDQLRTSPNCPSCGRPTTAMARELLSLRAELSELQAQHADTVADRDATERDLRAENEKLRGERETLLNSCDNLDHHRNVAEEQNEKLREALRGFREFIDIEHGRDDEGDFHSLTVQEIWNRLHDAFPWLEGGSHD